MDLLGHQKFPLEDPDLSLLLGQQLLDRRLLVLWIFRVLLSGRRVSLARSLFDQRRIPEVFRSVLEIARSGLAERQCK